MGETGPAWHAHALSDPGQEHLVAIEAETPVGFAVLAGLHGNEAIELRRMVISPAHRRTGRGRAPLTAVLTRAYRHHGVQRIWLDVKAHNHRARSLYESEGFTVTDMLTGAITEADGTLWTSSSWPTKPNKPVTCEAGPGLSVGDCPYVKHQPGDGTGRT